MGVIDLGESDDGAGQPGNGGHPLVGLIRNPRSHRNKGLAPELASDPLVLTEAPRSHEDLRKVLEGFAARDIAILAVDGGDGTVRDVLSCGAPIWGESWPELIVLPKGKTNALTVDLGLPNRWSLAEALEAARAGRRVERRPLLIRPETEGEESLLGFVFGAGVFSLGIEAGQDAHRMGAFNSFAVGLTIAWGILKALFGWNRTPWRACTPMTLVERGTGRELPRGPHGRPGERYVVMATTFERFPLGIKPLGSSVAPGLKLGIIDWPLRWLVALMPAILIGFFPGFVARNGAHRVKSGPLDMDLGGSFILDGEAYPGGRWHLAEGPQLRFVVP